MHRQTHLDRRLPRQRSSPWPSPFRSRLQALAQQPQPAPATPAQPPAGRGGPPGASNAPGGFPRVPTLPFPDAPREVDTVGVKLRAVPVAKGLVNPWSIAFLPNGDMLVTERPGRLRIVRKGTLDPEPIAGTPQVWATGQGGLLEVLPHPQFAQNNLLYLTYSKPCEKGATTALLRGKFDGKALTDAKDLFVADNCNTGNPHFGSKLAFGRDGMLYMTIGERGDRVRSQNTNIHGGKILQAQGRRHGSAGQPVRREAGATSRRSTATAIAIHRGSPFTRTPGVLWATEHGPQGGDELNNVQAGKNYGWPVASYGREYGPNGVIVSEHPWKEGIEEPTLLWIPSIGASGLMVYTRRAVPGMEGTDVRGWPLRPAGAPLRVQREGRPARPRSDDRAAAPAHPRHQAGPRRLHLSRGRPEPRRRAAAGAGQDGDEVRNRRTGEPENR